ncbi:MAG: DNA polymerase delta catalytic subunit [Amphiamblys sp. WSBS2006]|nr:MAG: DNA polymerase delta catalytic subunit [Amphiamblys sp. WSBS2006]
MMKHQPQTHTQKKTRLEALPQISFQQFVVEEAAMMDKVTNKTVYWCYGVASDGRSIACRVCEFKPYFLGLVPRVHHNKIQAIKESITATYKDKIDSITVVYGKNFYGYNIEREVFLKIKAHDLQTAVSVRKHTTEVGVVLKTDKTPETIFLSSFEAGIPSVLRFMIDTEMTGMCWITLPQNKYTEIWKKTTRCEMEVSIDAADMICHDSAGEWSAIGPIKILFFDIECTGRGGAFPEAQKDPVIQIGNEITVNGETESRKDLFALKGCSDIPGVAVHGFEKEEDLLLAWKEYVCQTNPDMIVGYNINNFDLPYLFERAEALKVSKFRQLGRVVGKNAEMKKSVFQSSAYGTRISHDFKIQGRIVFDIFQVIQRDFKLRSYSLNSVSSHFLKKQKEDVKHTIIGKLQTGNSETRKRIGTYCMRDVSLTRELTDKLMLVYNYSEMARVTGIPFAYVLQRGQQVRVMSRLLRTARGQSFYIPDIRGSGSEEQYEGATVIEPKKGYYNTPITTLDFVSLYPSIMISNNLCYTTHIPDKRPAPELGLSSASLETTPCGDVFVSADVRRGVVPEVLRSLLGARAKAKAELQKETDPFKRAVLNGRQNALKLCANSVYGFTGASNGILPCLAISRSTTAYGRAMIEMTREIVMRRFTTENGYKTNADVIYGDTDSVMIKFGVDSLEEAMALGRAAAEHVTGHFRQPVQLCFEKVYFPYLLIAKKRYAGLYWTRPDKHDKMDAKGIESVRRDNCPIVQKVITTALDMLLLHRDADAAGRYVKQAVSDLLQNRLDISELVITKTFTKEDYAGKQAHVELVKKMRLRDEKSAPSVGERVSYVVVKGIKNAKLYERAEDPLYVLKNNIPIDTTYYLDNQLAKPILRIFAPIVSSPETLLAGEHTRKVSITAPTHTAMSKFVVKVNQCMNCKNKLPGDSALCEDCKPMWKELMLQKTHAANRASEKFARLWTQCQRCQGSLHQEVICTNNDCPIFYMRFKSQADSNKLSEEVKRLELDW